MYISDTGQSSQVGEGWHFAFFWHIFDFWLIFDNPISHTVMTVLSQLFRTIPRYLVPKYQVPAGTPVLFLSDFSFLSDQNRYY